MEKTNSQSEEHAQACEYKLQRSVITHATCSVSYHIHTYVMTLYLSFLFLFTLLEVFYEGFLFSLELGPSKNIITQTIKREIQRTREKVRTTERNKCQIQSHIDNWIKTWCGYQ